MGHAWVRMQSNRMGHAWVTMQSNGMGHAWVTMQSNRMGHAWVTMQSIGMGHAWVTMQSNGMGHAWVTEDVVNRTLPFFNQAIVMPSTKYIHVDQDKLTSKLETHSICDQYLYFT